MTQLQSLMSQTTAKIKSEAVDKTSDKKTFFEKNKAKLLSGEAHQSYAGAISLANVKTDEFMKAVYDSKHPDHAKNLVIYSNDENGRDINKIRKSFINQTCDNIDSPDPEDLKEDLNYERNMINAMKPQGEKATLDNLKFYDILKENLKKSRDEKGYGRDRCNDKKVIAEWSAKYGMK